jgi:hypothetical protein
VQPLGSTAPLSSVPVSRTRASIRAALVAQTRDAIYPNWIAGRQAGSFDVAVCWRDELPALGEVDLTEYVPFLSLSA